MKLFRVFIESYYDARYEGLISKDYTSLVVAKSEDDARIFVQKTINRFYDGNSIFSHPKDEILDIIEIDMSKISRSRKTKYYK